jgi:hypothetical protein
VGQKPDVQELLSSVWKDMKPDNLPPELRTGPEFDADQACKKLCDMISAETKSRPMLLLLDDVWTTEQVRDLDFVTLYGGANKLVVTTRDERTLNGRYEEEHHREWVPALSNENARKLLCYHAFCCEEPGPGYEEYIPNVLSHCRNLPLTIQVCASLLVVSFPGHMCPACCCADVLLSVEVPAVRWMHVPGPDHLDSCTETD